MWLRLRNVEKKGCLSFPPPWEFHTPINGTPLQYSCLVTRSWTWLRDFTFTFHFHALEKEMATHSTILAWRIPGTGEPGGLKSMGSLRVGHNSVTSLSLFIFMHWRRKWQSTPVFLPGESQGWRCLVSCHLWDRRVRHDWSDLAAAAAAAATAAAAEALSNYYLHLKVTERYSSIYEDFLKNLIIYVPLWKLL